MILNLNEEALDSEGMEPVQPNVVFGRSEELDPYFQFMHDADDLIAYPFAMVRWVDTEFGQEDFSVTVFSEAEIDALMTWATISCHEQFELNRGHSNG